MQLKMCIHARLQCFSQNGFDDAVRCTCRKCSWPVGHLRDEMNGWSKIGVAASYELSEEIVILEIQYDEIGIQPSKMLLKGPVIRRKKARIPCSRSVRAMP
ncbi:hypothetical protein AJ87_19885 [Rhizobium yanglingense]|nr:hypothetical protein AJ87_19885 [Rhizobium yanglingense]